jgi:hypothetical protein
MKTITSCFFKILKIKILKNKNTNYKKTMEIDQNIEIQTLKHHFEVEDETIKHNFEIEDKNLDNQWKSCCLTLDKHFTQYITQMIILLLIIIFCIVQLILKEDCDNQRAYVGLLTFILGILMPQPKIK